MCVRNPARPAADHPLVSTTQAAAQRQARQWDSRSKPPQLQPQLRHTHVSRQAQRRQQQQVQQQAEAGALVVPTVITSFPEHLRPEVLANGVLLVDKPPHWEVCGHGSEAWPGTTQCRAHEQKHWGRGQTRVGFGSSITEENKQDGVCNAMRS